MLDRATLTEKIKAALIGEGLQVEEAHKGRITAKFCDCDLDTLEETYAVHIEDEVDGTKIIGSAIFLSDERVFLSRLEHINLVRHVYTIAQSIQLAKEVGVKVIKLSISPVYSEDHDELIEIKNELEDITHKLQKLIGRV